MSKNIYVAYSGGADSTALAVYLQQKGYNIEGLVFADTGAELPETYDIIPRVAQRLGVPLFVICNGTFFQWFNEFGYMIPGPRRRWCTRILKQAPQNHFFAGKDIPVAIGIRADEPNRLADEEQWVKSGNDYEYCRPLLDAGIDRAGVMQLCGDADLVNPAYEWRTNVSCYICPFQRLGDWRNLRIQHPDLYALAEGWERLSIERSLTAGKNPITFFKGGKLRDGRYRTLENLRQQREDQMLLDFDEPEEAACLICQW